MCSSDLKSDPELMQKLMEKPDPRAVESLFSEQNKTNLVRGAIAGRTTGTETQKMAGGSVDRIRRASGGKVGRDIAPLVSRLMGLADQAKKATDNHTKPLLDAPDESIVKALRVANQAI